MHQVGCGARCGNPYATLCTTAHNTCKLDQGESQARKARNTEYPSASLETPLLVAVLFYVLIAVQGQIGPKD